MHIPKPIERTWHGSSLAGKYQTGLTYLCDRIIGMIASKQNVILTAPRGYGKNNMVHEIAFKITKKHKDFQVVNLNLYKVFSRDSFLDLFIEKILQIGPSEKKTSLRKQYNDGEILSFPDRYARRTKKRILICIGDIQNIARFENPVQFQKELREKWRIQTNCVYLFHGNNSLSIRNIFENQRKPLYRFGRVFELKMTKLAHLDTSIEKQFFDTGKRITAEATRLIIASTDHHVLYTHLLTNQSWLRTSHTCTEPIVEEAINDLISHLCPHFIHTLDSLTHKQIHFLKSLLANSDGYCTAENLRKYKLGRSSNVSRIRESLVNKDMIRVFGDVLTFADPLFYKWLWDFFNHESM